MTDAAIVAIVVSLITAAGGFFTALQTKRKIDADSASVSVKTMQTVLLEVRTELKRCHDQRKAVEQRLIIHSDRIDKLEKYLRRNHGVDPDDINGHPI